MRSNEHRLVRDIGSPLSRRNRAVLLVFRRETFGHCSNNSAGKRLGTVRTIPQGNVWALFEQCSYVRSNEKTARHTHTDTAMTHMLSVLLAGTSDDVQRALDTTYDGTTLRVIVERTRGNLCHVAEWTSLSRRMLARWMVDIPAWRELVESSRPPSRRRCPTCGRIVPPL